MHILSFLLNARNALQFSDRTKWAMNHKAVLNVRLNYGLVLLRKLSLISADKKSNFIIENGGGCYKN